MADDALRMPSGLHIHEDTYNDDPEISDRQVRIF